MPTYSGVKLFFTGMSAHSFITGGVLAFYALKTIFGGPQKEHEIPTISLADFHSKDPNKRKQLVKNFDQALR